MATRSSLWVSLLASLLAATGCAWSVERAVDPNDWKPSLTLTDREKLLRKWFAENRRPGARE